ncbi:MAG: c-type cytochrome [Pirellulales bacterium]
MLLRNYLAFCLAFVVSLVQSVDQVSAQFEEDYGTGLIGHYQAPTRTECKRVDSQIAFVWDGNSPDPRIDSGMFKAKWTGFLLSKARGPYTLQVYAQGKVRIQLEGQVLLDATADKPQWLTAKTVELQFDWHPIVIEFEKRSDAARLGLFWEGPNFQLEPVSSAYLFHDVDESFVDPFERGKQLISALRCTGCHQIEGQADAFAAPALDKLSGNISEPWLRAWLKSNTDAPETKSKDSKSPLRRMPHFSFTDLEANALTEYLLESSSLRKKGPEPIKPRGIASAGKTLFQTLGCLACHQTNDLGNSSLFGGSDLSDIAAKRPVHYYERWLKDPAKLNADHRMPVYDLDAKSRANLATYLGTLSSSGKLASLPRRKYSNSLVAKGRELAAKHQCFSCHKMAANFAEAARTKPVQLSPGDLWHDACLAEPDRAGKHPGYKLSAEDKAAIKTYIQQISRVTKPSKPQLDGRMVMSQRNCLSCHPRGLTSGLADTAQLVIQQDSKLTSQLPAMIPPSLNSMGDKLHEQAMIDMIQRTNQKGEHRPWLKVQMPKFNLSDDELAAIVKHLVDTDRVPDHPSHIPVKPDAALAYSGARLVTTGGFGCTSCHQVGKMIPPKAPLNAIGPDLSMLGSRIRKSWFDRWVNNPARIVPRMEMPSVQVPVHGVLEDDLHQQLAAVWHVLNTPGFQPPKPDPVRIVRSSGLPEQVEEIAALTDVLDVGEARFIKPLLFGLPNRHNMLFDLESASLAGWWIGDTAWQRSEGKTWFWEAGSTNLISQQGTTPEIQLLDAQGKLISPIRTGQFFTEFDELRHNQGTIEFSYRLHFGDSQVPVVYVTETVSSVWPENSSSPSGFQRSVEIDDLPEGYTARLRLADYQKNPSTKIDAAGSQVSLQSTGGLTIAVGESQQARIVKEANLAVVNISDTKAVLLRYTSTLPVDKYIQPPIPVQPKPVARTLDIVPGWNAVQLPLATEMMPTAMSWKPNGTMVVASLKGRIWLLNDTNGDGLEDVAQAFGDELAAPFGVQAYGTHIDVLNKYGLMRLHNPKNQVGYTQLLASGWAHTDDYHDWAIGLPKDEQGNYYMATACQQDDRTAEGAKLRGSVMKLIPRDPTKDDPRLFAIEELTAGHRFPVGIARNQQGQMFVPDNQGNYNPFNELNHIVPGRRYGFINKIDRKPGFNPVATPPSIAIPHPWTRSVNGICFLETPKKLHEKLGYPVFGAFEGHLIGCEYDTRRLIRMSLDQVGDTLQGAVYPFTYDPGKEVKNSLLGPITCSVSPNGELYIGSMRDAGWGGGNNVGSLVRLKPESVHMPLGIAEVRALPDGFEIEFTDQVDEEYAKYISSYKISSYTRESTPAYGGDNIDARNDDVVSTVLSPDRLRVKLILSELRAGYVYELHLDEKIAGKGKKLWPAEAYYTMRNVPKK